MMTLIKLMFLALSLASVNGMDCSFGRESSDLLSQITNQLNKCPGLLDSSDKSYCCPNESGEFYCCDLWNFLLTSSLIILPIAAILFIISFIISCICCFCCPFCCIYKRRNGRIFI